MNLILASASPRRQEILSNAGYTFRVRPADLEERFDLALPIGQATAALAAQKAACVAQNAAEDEVILAADTVVAHQGHVLGKPKDASDAFAMLRLLSGSCHTVYTGVCIAAPGAAPDTFFCSTTVQFYPLTDDTIRQYIATGEPMDKAGGYGIQGYGCLLVERMEGDYFNVMGLPIAQTARRLAQYGVNGRIL